MTKMDTSKIAAALEELRTHREVIGRAIESLENALNLLGGDLPLASDNEASSNGHGRVRRTSKTFMDHALEILISHGPMHIDDLTKAVSEVAGREVSRATLDGGMSREIREQPDRSRFIRISPGNYAISE